MLTRNYKLKNILQNEGKPIETKIQVCLDPENQLKDCVSDKRANVSGEMILYLQIDHTACFILVFCNTLSFSVELLTIWDIKRIRLLKLS